MQCFVGLKTVTNNGLKHSNILVSWKHNKVFHTFRLIF